MPKVIYKQTLSRTIEVEVSDEQLATLKDHDAQSNNFDSQYRKLKRAIDFVITVANEVHEEDAPLEFVSAICVDEHDEELFDL